MPRLPEALQALVRTPRHVGAPVGADRTGRARNAACGDTLVLYLARADGRVRAAGFKAQGCPAAVGTASAAAGLLAGMDLGRDLPERLAARFREAYGEPARLHRHALALVTEALRDALSAPG